MGMYTELVLKVKIKHDIPTTDRDVLEYLFNGGERPKVVPGHAFFEKPNWDMIGRCSSYYHTPFSLSKIEGRHLFSRSDLKNYDGEIEAFLDWLRPMIDELEDRCIGWTWYEEESSPTLIYKEPARDE